MEEDEIRGVRFWSGGWPSARCGFWGEFDLQKEQRGREMEKGLDLNRVQVEEEAKKIVS